MVTDALRQALDVRHRADQQWQARWSSAGEQRQLVHHSDAGSQYTSVAFTAELLRAGLAGSIGTVGDALDNALCESTIGLFKTEAIDDGGPTWAYRREVEWQVARRTHWYNTERLHSSNGHLPPIEFEQLYRQAKHAVPAQSSDSEVAQTTTLRRIQGGSAYSDPSLADGSAVTVAIIKTARLWVRLNGLMAGPAPPSGLGGRVAPFPSCSRYGVVSSCPGSEADRRRSMAPS